MRLIIIFLLILSVHTGLSQISVPTPYVSGVKLGYVRSWDASAPEQNIDTLKNRSVVYVKQSTQYIDGFGRPIQIVQKQISPNQKDMVSSAIYDDYGREVYKYLPYESVVTAAGTDVSNDGNFKLNAFQQQKDFSQSQYPGETYFYAKTSFEASPLNKPLESFAPGNSWVGSEADTIVSHHHSMRIQYLTNSTNDSVRIWKVNITQTQIPGYNEIYSYTTTANYSQGQLYKAVTIDEHNKQTIEFKDKEGKVVLKKVQLTDSLMNGHSGWLCTYYVYDIYNNLRFVIPPKAVGLIADNTWDSAYIASVTKELCYQYVYDNRNRMIVKKIPGAGPVYMVYDILDRLVMTQDSSLQVAGKWLVTEYDALSRPLRTGLWTNALDRTYHQSQTSTLTKYPTASSLSTNYDTLTESYYDNYDWVSGSGTSLGSSLNTTNTSNSSYFYTGFGTSPSFAQQITQNTATRGIVTGSKIKVLGANQYLYTVSFYDDKGRCIQSQSTNISSGIDIVTTQYDWSGKALRMLIQHQKSGTNTQTHLILTKMEYDHAGRLLKIKKTMNSTINSVTYSSTEKTIVTNQYDNAGQLKNKIVGDSTAGVTEKLVNDFNIRGWLTGTNKEYIKDSINSHWFGFELGYNKENSVISSTTYNTQQFNGNISGMIWKSGGDKDKRKYDFSYDNVNRLIGANFNQRFDSSWAKTDPNNSSFTIDFSVDSLRYDANGNILTMQQKGLKLHASPVIDKMSYSYMNSGVSNKLLSVTEDGTIGTTNNKLGDFTDINTSNDDYGYDGNGNLIFDKNKRIDSIYYNYLNLPTRIRVNDSSSQLKGIIEYKYDATGNKLEKKTTEGSLIINTKYIGGFVYQNDTLQFTQHEEGRIRFAKKYFVNGDSTYGLFYDYFLKDHLGNTRVILTEQKDTAAYPAATMEIATATSEEKLYGNLPATRADLPISYPPISGNAKVAKVDGGKVGPIVGPSMVLKVMAGDKFNVMVDTWYINGSSPDAPTNNPLTDLVNALSGGIASVGGKATQLEIINGGFLTPGVSHFLGSQTPAGGRPKAYLNWILFDEHFNFVSSSSGFEQVPAETVYNNGGFAGNNTYPIVESNLPVDKNGFLYIYVSNETPNIDVFFDNLQITHIKGPLLEETHYYPFGLTMAGITSKADGKIDNRKSKYNGYEFNSDFDINLYESFYRSHDPQLGRFWQIDPKPSENISPYSAMNNNPVLLNDPLGDTSKYNDAKTQALVDKYTKDPKSKRFQAKFAAMLNRIDKQSTKDGYNVNFNYDAKAKKGSVTYDGKNVNVTITDLDESFGAGVDGVFFEETKHVEQFLDGKSFFQADAKGNFGEAVSTIGNEVEAKKFVIESFGISKKQTFKDKTTGLFIPTQLGYIKGLNGDAVKTAEFLQNTTFLNNLSGGMDANHLPIIGTATIPPAYPNMPSNIIYPVKALKDKTRFNYLPQ